jgi:hypothetical protein
MNVPSRLTSRVAVCFHCEALYVLPAGYLMSEPLPCGHVLDILMGESSLLAALRDADFIEWAHNHGVLDAPIDALRAAGGAYSPWAKGPARLRLPGGAK